MVPARGAAAVALLAVLVPGLPPSEAIDGCGPEQPPSGLYLDLTTLRLFQYDCFTGTLAPTTEEPAQGLCIHDVGPSGNLVPRAGACAVVEQISRDTFRATMFIALVGHFADGAGVVHGHSDTFAVSCDNVPGECKPRVRAVAGLPADLATAKFGVSFLGTTIEGTHPCGATSAELGAHLNVWGPTGSISTNDDQLAILCDT